MNRRAVLTLHTPAIAGSFLVRIHGGRLRPEGTNAAYRLNLDNLAFTTAVAPTSFPRCWRSAPLCRDWRRLHDARGAGSILARARSRNGWHFVLALGV